MARVLYIITSSGVGGAELALWQLLRRLDRSRWEPTVVSLKPPGETAGRIRALGIEVLSPGIGDESGAFAALELLVEARRLPRLLGGRRFDIVHSLLFRANLLARLAAPRPAGAAHQRGPRHPRGGRAGCGAWTAEPAPRHLLSRFAKLAAGSRRACLWRDACGRSPTASTCRGRSRAGQRHGRRRADSSASSPGNRHRAPWPTVPPEGAQHLLGAFRALLQVQPTARLLSRATARRAA
jgi:hypothetical protein